MPSGLLASGGSASLPPLPLPLPPLPEPKLGLSDAALAKKEARLEVRCALATPLDAVCCTSSAMGACSPGHRWDSSMP